MSSDSALLGNDVLENAYYRMLDAAPDALVIADAEGTIRLVNAQTEVLFGYQRDELLGAPIELLLPEPLRKEHVAHRDRFAAAPKVRAMGSGLSLFGRRKDGTTFPLEVSLSPLKTEAGLFILSALRDVTDRKRAEKEARIQGERLLSAVESIQGMFVLFDKDDRVVLCNSSFRQFFEQAITGAIVGRSFTELVDGSLRCDLFDLEGATPQEFRANWVALHQLPVKSFELRTKDGRTLRFSDRLTGGGDVVKTIWDVTDDVQAADELRRAQVVAESASSAKSEFLASMSHELRTPLNAILGFAQLLQRDKKTPLTERQRLKVDHILKGGEHLLRLIDDVLDLARIEAGRVTISLEPVAVIEVLREVRATLDPMAVRPEVELQLDEDETSVALVCADRVRFAQVLMNFGSNAIKYGKRQGRVRFAISRPEPGIVRVSVLDDGAGIAPELQGKLFEPFQRAGQELGPIEGTGIGLMICQRLATIMGGAVGFHSELGVGSEFWIDLPEHTGDERVAVKPSPQALPEAVHGVRRVVVYIEDNPSNIAFMQDVMEDLAHVELLTAPTAEIGIELVRSRQPDLVLMDINLPGMNGIEATRRLREWPETRDIPVVALTAAALLRDSQKKEIAVFDRYLTKPLKVDELMATLEQLFEQRLRTE
ncbi:MAG: Family ership [Pseudomonadota bacterium]|jgi:PAS domain S-box-containing protein